MSAHCDYSTTVSEEALQNNVSFSKQISTNRSNRLQFQGYLFVYNSNVK